MDKREQIKKYFKKFPKWAAWMVGIGAIVALVSGMEAGGIVLGVVLVGIGGWAIWNSFQTPSDSEMDAWLEEDLKVLNQKALSKTGTDQSELGGERVMVTGPRFWDVLSANVGYKKGKDGTWRFTPVGVTVLNFTANQLVCYTCSLDLETGNPLNESTDEYFYKDIVSVSTKTKSLAVKIGEASVQLNSAETFELTTSGGTSIEVVLRDPSLIKHMGGGGEIPTTRAEKAIQTVRKMLREKKAIPG